MSELSELANEFRDHALRFNERVARLERGRFFSGQSAIFSLARAKAQILAINRSVDVDGRTVLELEIRATTNELGLHYFERENVEAFVLVYRMLTQNNDGLSISRLAKRYEHAHPALQSLIEQIRAEYLLFLDAASPFSPGGHAVCHREILETVIYGELAHTNKGNAGKFAQWTRYPSHANSLWLVFDGALRTAMEFLRCYRDINALSLLTHFGIPVEDETVFRRLQAHGLFAHDAQFDPSASTS